MAKSKHKKNKINKKTKKKYLGGYTNLAYTGNNNPSISNPFLAYKGGRYDNINAANKTVPNTGPPVGIATAVTNEAGAQRGGSCGPLCMVGGNHRLGCKCTSCKNGQHGGNTVNNSLVGKPWNSNSSEWPGVDNIQGNRNHLALNNYLSDVQRSIKGGNKKQTRKQKGGNLSNFLTQDLINLGRQFQFNLGSAYNGLAGYSSPVNPMPWKEQLVNTPSLNTVKASLL